MAFRSFCRPLPLTATPRLDPLFIAALVTVLLGPLKGLPAQSLPTTAQVSKFVGAVAPSADSLRPARLLAEVQAAAVALSPELAARRAQLDAVRARARAAGLAQPLSLSAGVSEAPNASLDQGNVRLEVGRELFAGPRLRAERGVADAAIRAAQAALDAAERRVRLTTWREAIRAAGTRIIAARLSAEDALLAGGEDGVRSRFSVGQARYVDVLRVRTERLRVQTERAEAVAESRAAVAALRGLVGRGVTPGLERPADDARLTALLDTLATAEFADAWRAILPPDGRSDVRMLDSVIAAAGDVQLADAEVVRARAEGALAAASRRPQVSALAGLQRIGQSNSGAAFGPSLGVTVSLPFTARRANRLGAAADSGHLVATELARAATLAAVRARIEAAAERFAAARERLSVFDAALLRGARDEREGALASYRSGGLSLLELVDFERALARAEIDRIRALVDAATAWAELSSGGDTAEEPVLLNSGSTLEDKFNAR